MRPHLSLTLLLALALSGPATSRAQAPPATALPANPAMTKFVDELLGKMTQEEKIGQLNLVSVGFDVTGPVVSKDVEANIRRGRVGGVFNTFTPVAVRKLQAMALKETRLHIPLLFGYDVIHGHRTIFPIPLGLAASWDLAAIERSARVAADEASADGINWVFSPMVDIARDPRWGRSMEGAGEDPYLGSQVARAMVRGYQGPNNDLTRPTSVLACVKHFALYGAAEAGRDYNTTDMSLPRMYNEYLLPYRAAVEAGAGSIMTSFNDVNGTPATGNKFLLTDVLRRQWGFNGLIATDYTSIPEMIAHGVGNETQVSAQALNAGVDMDMVGEVFLRQAAQNIKDGQVSAAQLDAACRYVLETKYRLGLFKDPYRGLSEARAKATLFKPAYQAAAREVARRTLVLLRNEKQTLPLKKSGTLALIGPLADRPLDMLGAWSGAGDGKLAVSVAQGIRQVGGPGVQLLLAHGANVTDDPQLIARLNAHGGELATDPRPAEAQIEEAVAVARRADVVVAVVGEAQGMSGEAASRGELGLPGRQLDLLKALKATGKPLVVILMNGRALALPWESQHADALLEAWFGGSQAGSAVADVLFGDYNPAGKVTVSFPVAVGQVPIYYNHKSTGRPYAGELLDKYKSRYLDLPNEPLYPFGYGLSYTSFSYSKPELSAAVVRPGEALDVRVTLRNTGERDGEETAQLYLRDVVGSSSRPVRELKGFQKVFLKKGESRVLTFRLSTEDLKFYNADLQWVAEPGEFQVFVGPNSRDGEMAAFTLN